MLRGVPCRSAASRAHGAFAAWTRRTALCAARAPLPLLRVAGNWYSISKPAAFSRSMYSLCFTRRNFPFSSDCHSFLGTDASMSNARSST
jgi:hypothetical protein